MHVTEPATERNAVLYSGVGRSLVKPNVVVDRLNIPASFLGGPGLKSRPRDRLR
jgi:hypothetical protein